MVNMRAQARKLNFDEFVVVFCLLEEVRKYKQVQSY